MLGIEFLTHRLMFQLLHRLTLLSLGRSLVYQSKVDALIEIRQLTEPGGQNGGIIDRGHPEYLSVRGECNDGTSVITLSYHLHRILRHAAAVLLHENLALAVHLGLQI